MQYPTIHLNGTSAESLLEDLGQAYTALGEAYEKLQQCAPNGRDYYVKPGTMETARAEHHDRLRRVESVREELVMICDDIWRQKSERR